MEDFALRLKPELSKHKEDRFVVVSRKTGEVLDDASGYGFRTREKAFKYWISKQHSDASWLWSTSPNLEMKHWVESHHSFIRWLDYYALCIAKGMYGEEKKVDLELIKEALDIWDYQLMLPYAQELFVYWKKYIENPFVWMFD